MKVIISKDLKNYFSGKADGIQFLNVTEEDAKILEAIATKYSKEIKIMESIVSTYEPDKSESTKVEEVEEPVVKPKERKVWINDGSEAKRINESELPDYLNRGYKVGKKTK